jgi:hypothetical protein
MLLFSHMQLVLCLICWSFQICVLFYGMNTGILIICYDIILSCCVVSGWVLPAGFSTRAGVGMG